MGGGSGGLDQWEGGWDERRQTTNGGRPTGRGCLRRGLSPDHSVANCVCGGDDEAGGVTIEGDVRNPLRPQFLRMNFTEVLKKIPTPQINLPNVQLPAFGKDTNNGKAPLNMNKEDMEQLITNIQHTTLATEDGAFVALWILTLIDHWNNEHERIVVLTERSFYIIRYDFLSGHIRESKRVGLGQLVSVTTGPLVFPTKSLMPTRTSPGVQLVWGDLGSVTAAQKWNPLCRNLPYVVLTHHPLLVKQNQLPSGQASASGAGYGHDTNAGTLYDVNNFLQAVRDACSASSVEFKTGDITIESYGNLGSVVFNQTSLGFTRSKVPVAE